MKSLQKQLLEFLEGQNSTFSNSCDVEFGLSDCDDRIMACCNFPDFGQNEKFCLELLYDYRPVLEFIQQFSICNLNDIREINAKRMEKLFHLGYVELWCHIYPSEKYLAFRKKENCFQVINDDMEHYTSSPLVICDDFYSYTRYYFSA